MILLIEDNPGDVALFRSALRATAAQCRVVATTRAAIELLAADDADYTVVVIDLRLPGDDGWTLIEQLRAQPTLKTQAVILTSSANGRDCQRATEAGIQHFWTKPDAYSDFEQIVQQIAALDRA